MATLRPVRPLESPVPDVASTTALLAFFEYGILALLGVLSIATISIALERGWAIFRRRPAPEAVESALRRSLEADDPAALASLPFPEARILAIGAAYLENGVRAAQFAMGSARLGEQRALERGLAFIGTVGANAPFIGLLGTVVGLLRAFWELAESTGRGSETVIAAIGSALVATAAGLAVAIPAVALYNFLLRAARARLVDADRLGGMLLAAAVDSDDATDPGARRG
jgi:biopolymer transport protein ExbB